MASMNKLPDAKRVQVIACTGYPERDYGPVTRRPLAEVAMIDRYGFPFSGSSFDMPPALYL